MNFMISSAEEAALLVSWMIVTAKDMSINATESDILYPIIERRW